MLSIEAKLIERKNIYYENSEKNYIVIEKAKKNSWRSTFDYLADSRNHVITNRRKNDFIGKKILKSCSMMKRTIVLTKQH